METCRLKDFLKVMEPWLDRDYIGKVFLDGQDHLVLSFTDGGQKSYHIDDCTRTQLKDLIDNIQRRGISVEKIEGKC